MSAAAPLPVSPALRVEATTVFVRGLKVEAHIGVYHAEEGRTQPLVIDADLEVRLNGGERLEDTVNYEILRAAARAVAAEGHIALVETFAWRLAQRTFDDARVLRARIRVEKPLALAPDAAAAGVEIVVARG